LVFQPRDFILQDQFALLQPLNLQLIEWCAVDNARDDIVEVTMLAAQLVQASAQFDLINWCAARHAVSVKEMGFEVRAPKRAVGK